MSKKILFETLENLIKINKSLERKYNKELQDNGHNQDLLNQQAYLKNAIYVIKELIAEKEGK